MKRRYIAPVLLGSFLLFALQPMAGKRLLPRFGGGAAIWTTCMLFFQVLLLAGYGYAHAISTRMSPRMQRRMHIGISLLSLLSLAAILNRGAWTRASAGTGDPVWAILLLLLLVIGLPYTLLASTSPLIQSWAAQAGVPPYRLYAASNAASFLALIGYPVLIEPWISVQHQFWLWSAGYAGYVSVIIWCAAGSPGGQHAAEENAVPGPAPARGSILRWLALSASGSSMLLAATNQMCQEIAVIPFLWILPLALYLLTFTICFDHERWYRLRAWGLALAILMPIACAFLALGLRAALWQHVLIDSLTLTATCMICHGELARSKPDPGHLTQFFLTISAGGALGGIFVAVIAPRVFTDFTEFPLAMAATALLALDTLRRSGAFRDFVSQPILTRATVSGLAIASILALYVAVKGDRHSTIDAVRNFYGILRIAPTGSPPWGQLSLVHGATLHGMQYQDPEKRRWPTTYFGPASGIGLAMRYHPRRFLGVDHALKVGLIGLGVGTIAAYGRPGDSILFYEINPAVDWISNQYFTFRKDSPATIRVVPGDARLQLESQAPQNFDVIAVDAFTSDAIPAHLLTRECAEVYRRHLKPDGLLLFHVSNRALDLAPVVRAVAARLGLPAMMVVSGNDPQHGVQPAVWVIVSANQSFWSTFQVQRAVSAWNPQQRATLEWTDDFTSLWRILRF